MKNKLYTALLLGTFAGSMLSCNKGDKKSTATPDNPYYFEFTLGGQYTKFANSEPQYSYMLGQVGGFQQPSPTVFYPSIELYFMFNRQATDADVKGLAGKRIRFNYASSDSVSVGLDYYRSLGDDGLTDNDDTSFNSYVDVSKVTFLRVDTVVGTPLDIYEINGTCKTMMTDYAGTSMPLEGGKFNMQISRVKR